MSAYESLVLCKINKQTESFSEAVLSVYFTELSAKQKPPTLWRHYSMLKGTIT